MRVDGGPGRGDGVDGDTLRMLQDLPADLRERGWELVASESGVLRWGTTPPYYKAVYLRVFDHGIDDAHRVSMLYRNGRPCARVSTNQLRSASWASAVEDAIGLMRRIDARRIETM